MRSKSSKTRKAQEHKLQSRLDHAACCNTLVGQPLEIQANASVATRVASNAVSQNQVLVFERGKQLGSNARWTVQVKTTESRNTPKPTLGRETVSPKWSRLVSPQSLEQRAGGMRNKPGSRQTMSRGYGPPVPRATTILCSPNGDA